MATCLLMRLALIAGVLLRILPLARAEEMEAAIPAADTDGAEEEDETKKLLKQLTISLVEDVVDERTITIRNAGKPGSPRMLLRLGNVAAPERAGLDEAAYKEKLDAAKAFLSKTLGRQMIHYKLAAEQHQPASTESGEEQVSVADVWLINGRHINTLLKKEGHAVHVEEYKEELARDILTAEAEETKKQSYKELEEALKESEKAKAKERAEKAKAAAKAEEEKTEPIGLAGYAGLMVFATILVGALTNFGRDPKKKKVNLNRKRSFVGKLWSKLKGM